MATQEPDLGNASGGRNMETNIAYGLMIVTLGFFGYVGYNAANRDMDSDAYLSARGTQNWVQIGLSLFASGMGIWILFGPSEVGYYGGFWDVVGYALSASTHPCMGLSNRLLFLINE